MLDNFIFSINIVLPIFLVLFIGYALRRKGFLSKDFIKCGNKAVFNAALPASLFTSVYSSDLTSVIDVKFTVFAVLTTIIFFLAVCALALVFIKDKTVIGTFVQGAFRGNFAILGLPLIINVIGTEGSAKSVLVITFVVPLYNVLSIIILTLYSNSKKPVNAKSIAFSVVKNPLIISIAAGMALSLLNVKLPLLATRTIGYFAAMSTPLALLCLGGSIEPNGMKDGIKYAVFASFIKTLVLPVICVPVAYLFGFRSNELVILLIMFGVPSAVSSYAMAVQMDGDSYIASMTVVLTTLMSVFSLTFFVYVFIAFGII